MDVKKILSQINESFIRKGATEIKSDDVQRVMDKADEITEKVVRGGPLQRFIKDVALLTAMVKDYWSGAYRQVPWGVIAAVVFVLLYVLSPIDMIPDFIPFVGLLDDALALGICLMLIEKDLNKYLDWKNSLAQEKKNTSEVSPSTPTEAA